MGCSQHARRTYPWNYLSFAVFTLTFAFLVGTVTSFYDVSVLALALGITAGVVGFVWILATTAGFDFTRKGAREGQGGRGGYRDSRSSHVGRLLHMRLQQGILPLAQNVAAGVVGLFGPWPTWRSFTIISMGAISSQVSSNQTTRRRLPVHSQQRVPAGAGGGHLLAEQHLLPHHLRRGRHPFQRLPALRHPGAPRPHATCFYV